MAYTPGYYYPNYPGYQNNLINGSASFSPYMNQQVMPAPAYSNNMSGNAQNGNIIWVDGEVGAKAYQMPAGQTGPIALWDMNDTIIYWKSINPMGIPNPLKKLHYTMEEDLNTPQASNESSQMNTSGTESSNVQHEIEQLRNDIYSLKEMLKNQNGGKNQQRYTQKEGVNNA